MLILLTREIWCCQSVKALCRARPNLLVQSSACVPSNSHMHSEGQLSSSEICCCSRFGWVPALDADLAVGTHSDTFTELQSVWDDMSLLKFKAWSLRASQSIHPMRLGDDGAEYSHKAAAFKSRHGRNDHPSSAQWKNMIYIYTLVKSYLLKVFLFFFIFFAMLVFGFWGWDSTNLALGTHGVTCILYICIYIYIYIIYILYYIYIY